MINETITGLKIGDSYPVRIMGVINLSKESFYKNSVVQINDVLATAIKMVEQGADIIDIGARSTWPLAEKISKYEECKRMIVAIKQLKDIDIPISVDTMFSDIAEKCLKNGADIINDVSGFTADIKMPSVIKEYDAPVIVMASNKVPGDPIGINAVIDSLRKIIHKAEKYEISKIIIDPAIGRWVKEKLPRYDFETIANLKKLRVFEKPILVAISRKSFIGDTLNKPPEERLYGSLAATAIAVVNGAHIIRTHDVKETLDVVRIAEKIHG